MRRDWTSEEKAMLRKLYIEERKWVNEIAQELNRGRGSIQAMISKMGLAV